MKTLAVAPLLLLFFAPVAVADLVMFGSGGNQFSMEFVTIGNPGNAADTTGSPNPAGSVPYAYNMGKYEVSEDMIVKANAEGMLGITKDARGANKPATGVSWNEAARFVNWLNTSSGFHPAYKFSTQPGDGGYDPNANISLWESGDAGFNAANPFRNSQAVYFLPSVDEWYKAAYYDPAANGGAGGYWNYPTGSDSTPTRVASGTAAGTAVYSPLPGPADITLAGGLSPYGTMGQGGNVWEWEETEFDLVNDTSSSNRAYRGGSFADLSSYMLSSDRLGHFPSNENSFTSFRVASIPEPSAMLYGAVVLLGALCWKLLRS